MNNIRHDVFSCLKRQLRTGNNTHTYDQFITFIDLTLQYLENHQNHDVIFSITRKQLLQALHEKGLHTKEYDAKKFINLKKLENYLEQLVFIDNRPTQEFLDLGYIPIFVEKKSSGGRGNQNFFYIDIKEISKNNINQIVDDEDDEQKIDVSKIKYYRTSPKNIKPSLFFRLFSNNGEIKLESIKGCIFFILLLALFLFFIVVFIATFAKFLDFTLNRDSINIIYFSIHVIGIFLIYKLWKDLFIPLNNLIAHRIIKAPILFIEYNVMNAELECYLDKNDNYKVYCLTEITSTCPICTAPIILAEGKPDQKAPLVGRCKEAPHAHVYSFDRMTMKGYFLGHQGYLTDTDLN